MRTNLSQVFQLALGPMLFLLCMALPVSSEKAWVLGTALWMISWWITESLPMGATALLPLLLLSLSGVLDAQQLASAYAHPLIFLFMGGFFLARGLEHHQLHRKLAQFVLKSLGHHPRHALAGTMLVTWGLSMWMSNTATAVMMLPLTLSMVRNLESSPRLERRMLLGLAWAANLGGMATLIGTPPNALFAAFHLDMTGNSISFGHWFATAAPISAVLLIIAYGILQRGLREDTFDDWRPEAIPWTRASRWVAGIFSLTVIAWMTRPIVGEWLNLTGYSDTWIALCSAMLLFTLRNPDNLKEALLPWSSAKHIEWGILLLFGGGLALAVGLKVSGWLDLAQGAGSGLPVWMWILVATACGVWLTEFFSNMALVSALLPVVWIVAQREGIDFETLAIPLTLGASSAFMLPIATPPNAIVFSTGQLKVRHMMQMGFWMNTAATIVITLLCGLMLA